MDLTYKWIDWVMSHVLWTDASSHAQERKFMEGLTLTIPGKIWAKGCSHKLSDLGYSDTGTKMSQLVRDYTNYESIEEAKAAFHTRKDQAVTAWNISTIGAVKTNAQGHCISNIIVGYHSPRVTLDRKPRLTVDILYRTTELLRKFGADLLFLRNNLIPDILEGNPWEIETPDLVRMYFPSCFFSALFIPVFYQYIDPVGYLQELKEAEGDGIFYRRCLYRTKTMLEKEPDTYKFASRKNMACFAEKLMSSGKIDKQKVQDFIRKEEIA